MGYDEQLSGFSGEIIAEITIPRENLDDTLNSLETAYYRNGSSPQVFQGDTEEKNKIRLSLGPRMNGRYLIKKPTKGETFLEGDNLIVVLTNLNALEELGRAALEYAWSKGGDYY